MYLKNGGRGIMCTSLSRATVVQSVVHDRLCHNGDAAFAVSDASVKGCGAVTLVLPQPGEYMFGCMGEGNGDPLLVNRQC
ncbi:hypothetical protein Hanom_Chr07g00601121 [Helianthus anomalus]